MTTPTRALRFGGWKPVHFAVLLGSLFISGLQAEAQSGYVTTTQTYTGGTVSGNTAQGGNGGAAAGGGGAGLGGALFLDTGADVILNGVSYTNNSAKGGNGFNSSYSAGGGGGGAGIGGGTGGSGGGQSSAYGGSGGGGGLGVGNTGGNGVYAGNGVVAGGAGAGGGGNGGANGNGGNFYYGSGGGGGGGIGNGADANGSGGGGGGAFGGGGGGGSGTGGQSAGNGGFGGGAGGNTGSGTLGTPGYGGGTSGGAVGGGGAGFGGAIFVNTGATLTIEGTSTFSGNSVAGGSGAYGGSGTGSAAGADIFLMSGTTLNLTPGAGHTITFSDANSIADDGGAGATVAVDGGGTVDFQQSNSYTGGTTINGGTTVVAGNVAALSTGNVSNQGGTLQLGDGNQTVTIGSYTQGGGGTLSLVLHSTTVADQVNVTGAASLNGTLLLNLSGIPNALSAPGTPGATYTYTLLTSASQTGTFTAIDTTSNPNNDALTLVYQNNDVVLDITSAMALFPTLNLTPNQQAVVGSLNYGLVHGNNSPGFVALTTALGTAYTNDPGSYGGAINQLTSANFGRFASSTAFNNVSFFTQQFDDYLANHRGADGTFLSSTGGIDYSGLVVNDPGIDTGLQMVHSRLLAWNPAPSTGLLSDSSSLAVGGVDMKDSKTMVRQNPEDLNPWNVFISGNVVLAQDFSDATAGTAHTNATTGAVQVGADYKITPNFLVGAMFGYGHTDADLDDIGSNASVDTYSPTLYASYADHGWYVNALGSYGFDDYDQNRTLEIGAFNGTAHSAPSGDQIVGSLDGGYDFHHDGWTFGPTAGVQYTHLDVDGYTETGLPGANLTVNQNQSDSLRSRLGGRVSYAFHGAGVEFTPHLEASWQHEFLDQSQGITDQFDGVGAGSFVVRTENPSRDSAVVDAGLDAQINKALTVFVDYSVQAGQSNYFGESVQAGLKIGF